MFETLFKLWLGYVLLHGLFMTACYDGRRYSSNYLSR